MPFENYKELLRLGWPYVTITLVSTFISGSFDRLSLNIVFAIICGLTGILAVIGCHRVFLLPKDTVAETSTFRWSSRESNYLLSILGIGILSSIISIPFYAVYSYLDYLEIFVNVESGIILNIIFQLMLFPVTYIVSRWSLILPDTAIDHENTFSWAWNVSSRHSIRLFVLIGAIPLIINFLFVFIGSFIGPFYFLSLLQNMVWLVVAVIEVCILSLSYEWIMSN